MNKEDTQWFFSDYRRQSADIMQAFPILQVSDVLHINFPLQKSCTALVQIQLAGLMKVAKGYDVY